MRCFDHIDLRVRNLEEVRSFYEILLPAIGFTKDAKIDGWIQYERAADAGAEFFGVTESPNHIANECRIAFWAPSVVEVNRLAEVVRRAGGCSIEGPEFEVPGYYAVFFEDASGNRFEICHRE
ncbi:MAG TPA: VOC family protein [Candidatus Acidoferrales bacterium]|jgi:predicted enzyme related to lactoylglutathione lyase|nr:VOC family protein [Candidatus Acidoferrales bacterium]